MTTAVASPEHVAHLLRLFGTIAWPVDRQAALDLTAACGWSVELETENSLDFLTNLGANDDSAHALVLSSERPDDVADRGERAGQRGAEDLPPPATPTPGSDG